MAHCHRAFNAQVHLTGAHITLKIGYANNIFIRCRKQVVAMCVKLAFYETIRICLERKADHVNDVPAKNNVKRLQREDKMPKALISYYSRSGNTKKMAEHIKEGIGSIAKMEVTVKKISETALEDMLNSDVIIIGSPTYFGVMTAEVKELMDKSIKYFGKLNGKIGGAFTSSGGIGGGNETTILSILQGFLIHGMIIQGIQKGNHYGPVSIDAPDESVIKECINYGKLLGQLAVKTL